MQQVTGTNQVRVQPSIKLWDPQLAESSGELSLSVGSVVLAGFWTLLADGPSLLRVLKVARGLVYANSSTSVVDDFHPSNRRFGWLAAGKWLAANPIRQPITLHFHHAPLMHANSQPTAPGSAPVCMQGSPIRYKTQPQPRHLLVIRTTLAIKTRPFFCSATQPPTTSCYGIVDRLEPI